MKHKSLLPCLCLALSVCASAQQSATQPSSPAPEEFEYPSVAAAYDALKARWDLERFSRDDGWLGFSDSRNKAIWTFAPAGHPAYPAVVKRVMVQDGNTVKVKTTAKCEAPKDACDKLLAEFRALDGDGASYLRFQNRNSSVNILKDATPPKPEGK
jgi:hypothetical protein